MSKMGDEHRHKGASDAEGGPSLKVDRIVTPATMRIVSLGSQQPRPAQQGLPPQASRAPQDRLSRAPIRPKARSGLGKTVSRLTLAAVGLAAIIVILMVPNPFGQDDDLISETVEAATPRPGPLPARTSVEIPAPVDVAATEPEILEIEEVAHTIADATAPEKVEASVVPEPRPKRVIVVAPEPATPAIPEVRPNTPPPSGDFVAIVTSLPS